MIRDDFELAEAIWDAGDPCLSEIQRQAVLTALHAGEPYMAILVVATALSRSGHPLPSALHLEFREWLRRLPAWDSQNGCFPMQLERHVVAADVKESPDVTTNDGRYGDATLCYFVLDDAGMVDASHEHQAEALRAWLLLDIQESPPCDGQVHRGSGSGA